MFTGLVDDSELVAYYETADLFVCMSEHEGFCVPLLESFYFDIPVVAYNAAAVPETLGGAGALINDKDPLTTAFLFNEILTDRSLKTRILEKQRTRLKTYVNYDYTTLLKNNLKASLC